MKRPFPTGVLTGLGVLLVLSACASPGGAPKEDRAPQRWPPGHYDLRATVSFRMDTESTTRTENAEYRADLYIEPDGSTSFQSSSGLCQKQTQDEIDLNRSRGVRTFRCQEVLFVLKPLAETVGGEATVSVQEGFRTRGPCRRYEQTASGDRVCVEYQWYVDYRTGAKRTSLRVMPRF